MDSTNARKHFKLLPANVSTQCLEGIPFLPLPTWHLAVPRRLCFRLDLFVGLCVCEQENSKTYGWILMKFSGYV